MEERRQEKPPVDEMCYSEVVCGSTSLVQCTPGTWLLRPIALFLVFNESAIAKIALCIYLRLTLFGNFVS